MSSEDLRGMKGIAIRVVDVLLVWASFIFLLPFAHAFKAPIESLGVPLTFSGGLRGVVIISMVFLTLRVSLVSIKVAIGLFAILSCGLILLQALGPELDHFMESVRRNVKPVVDQIGSTSTEPSNSVQPNSVAPVSPASSPGGGSNTAPVSGDRTNTGTPASPGSLKTEPKAASNPNQIKLDKALQDSAILEKLNKKSEAPK